MDKIKVEVTKELINKDDTILIKIPVSKDGYYYIPFDRIIQIYNDTQSVSPKGKLLFFDFYLPDYNTLIEYDGRQHYEIAFNQGEEKLILQKKYDKIKNKWCKNNKIILIRIPYFKKEIKLEDLIKGGNNFA